jgi:hypothetical protein
MVTVVMVPGWQAKVRGPMLQLQRDMAQETANDARDNIISDGLVGTGDLLGSVRQDGTRVYIGTDHWYYLEYGTPPHLIFPVVKQALWWEGASHPVRRVRHPGNREYAPMRRALYTKRG